MGINNPIPRSLKNETKKATNILKSFIKPNQVLNPNEVISPSVLKRCKGLIIMTVLKGAFLFGGRVGSGIIVTRLKDGTWSGPSGVILGGGSAGGQVGGELTDFVFCLMTDSAVNSFKEFGSVTLGSNVSVAAGMVGRSGEASFAANHKNVSSIFSYAKTKGAFAGVSLEGSVLLERRECNRKVYGANCSAKMILSGRAEPPEFAEPLYRILESRAFSYDTKLTNYSSSNFDYDSESNFDYDSESNFDDELDQYRREYGDDHRGRYSSDSRSNRTSRYDDDNSVRNYYEQHAKNIKRSEKPDISTYNSKSRWEDDIYDSKLSRRHQLPQARALYTFEGEEEGDLGFNKGDIINIIKKSESTNDWWTGEMNGAEGIFPANYVEMI
ncbi:related to SH3 domain-containing protein PJ696.02 [Hanseniaspora guilliermondii]|uniref:Related to SH3 domain-containing protein PJ696.02 n=1 Tax=Hanseniaspora guilliermondii TaxID=56406 RepID=A0A1L0AXX0_9ASCO|nr:related to SH3 domain-containing protein PJ696.02 [Hanseniaspora guilliermondii]